MKKLFKYLGIMFAFIFVILVLAIVSISFFVDPNEYRGEISELVKNKTGRELDIKGDLSLSLFPWVGLTIGETTMSNARGFGREPFAHFNKINIKVKIASLFSDKLEMDTIILDGVKLNLVKNKKGRSNWADLGEGRKVGKTVPEGATDRQKEGRLKSISITGIQIMDARLSWRDEQSATYYVIDKLNLKTGSLQPGKPVDLNLDFELVDQKAKKAWPFSLEGRLSADLEKQTSSFSGMKISFGDLLINGRVRVSKMLTTPVIHAELKSAVFVPRELFRSFNIAIPKTSDPTVFGKAQLEMVLSATPARMNISKLMIRLDDTTVKGSLSVSNFSRLAIRYKFDIDQLDADRYLPPADKQPEKQGSEKSGSSDQIELPFRMLRALDIDGSVFVGKLKATGLRSEDVKVTLNARNGLIRVYPASAKMYGGGYQGDISLDVRTGTMAISMNERLSGIQASPLFKDIMDMDWIEGTANLNARLTSRGNSLRVIKSNLNGNAGFAFLDGSIKGVNIPLKIRQAYTRLKGLPPPPDEALQTDFTSMKGTAVVRNGVIDNRDLDVQTPLLRVQGAGRIDLVRESMNYLVKSKVVGSLEGQGGDPLAKLKGVTIPVRISGPFKRLSYKVELEDIVKQEVKKKFRKKLKKKLEEKLRDRFKGLF
ncbi:MAG TPA: AsmA family protein [Gammaproteobacteria bacterium]|mgnify:CR=1 FL=1|nr:AsmA family protein [Gammaproteobacteria bacterium]